MLTVVFLTNTQSLIEYYFKLVLFVPLFLSSVLLLFFFNWVIQPNGTKFRDTKEHTSVVSPLPSLLL